MGTYMKYLIALLLCLSLCGCKNSLWDDIGKMQIGERCAYQTSWYGHDKKWFVVERISEEKWENIK